MLDTSALPAPEEVLPHRPPFLFLDEVISCEEERAVAQRRFDETEPFFAGHFPTRPVVPGVILIEALAQTLGYWALRERPDRWVLLTGVDGAKFSQVVEPGDLVTFTVEVLKARRGLVVAQGLCHVGERLVAQAQIKGYLQPRSADNSGS